MISTGNQRPCRGTTASDEPCKNDAAPGSLYCPWHDPQRVRERKEWSRKGGKASSTQRRLSRIIKDAEELTTAEVLQLLSGAMLLLMEAKLDPSHLSALASAARTLDQIRTSSDLQKRLEAIEAALDRADRRRIG